MCPMTFWSVLRKRSAAQVVWFMSNAGPVIPTRTRSSNGVSLTAMRIIYLRCTGHSWMKKISMASHSMETARLCFTHLSRKIYVLVSQIGCQAIVANIVRHQFDVARVLAIRGRFLSLYSRKRYSIWLSWSNKLSGKICASIKAQ